MNLDLFESRPEPDDGKSAPESDAGRASTEPAERGSSAPAAGAKEQDPAGSDPPRPERGEPGPGEPDGPRVWTVSEVNRAVRTLLEDTIPPLWIGGEVGGWTCARSGHRYFTLKDEEAELDCVMWRTDAERLPTDPEEGSRVRAFGSLTLYETRGRYQMVVRKLEGEGADGLWRIAFEKLRKKLKEEGLLAEERKRPVPRCPERVGVVTSTTGAAVRDVLTTIGRRAPWTRVVVRGTRVQGDGAAEEIADAIRVLAADGDVDVLIVGRGGGSIEDLWAFNEEPVARAIAACPVPVISAVGHEVDVTIADLVADHRAPTPSAAAEAAVPDGEVLLETFRKLGPRLARCLRGTVDRRWTAVTERFQRLGRSIERVLTPRKEGLTQREERLERGIRTVVERRRQWLARAGGKVEALSPLSTLKRGYAVPLSGEGRVLRSVREFDEGRRFVLRVVDGRVDCEVRDTSEEEEVIGE